MVTERGRRAEQTQVSAGDDNSVGPPDKSALARRDLKAVEELLGLFARAVQQLHTYPPTSPLCVTAIESCHRALAELNGRDQLALRVTPSELIVDHVPIGRGTQIEHELARRLHRASVASVTMDRTASSRELARFCEDLVRCGDRVAVPVTLLDRLTEHGVQRVTIEMASRPEVLEIGAVPPAAAEDVMRERARFDAQLAKGGVVTYLYPPHKGWVRLDPASDAATVSLLDLAVLADEPARLASLLLRLTDDAADVPPADALGKKYSEVARLISALDARIARRMFGKLARAVLDLDPGTRQALLRRTVLPGLLDGRVDGSILRDFPDVDLAESLCLLLDLETAAPELLATALARLELPAERHAAIVPLLDASLRQRGTTNGDDGRQTTLAKHARELVRVDGGANKSFREFAGFDLSLDDAATATLTHMRSAVPETDVPGARLTCLWHLICLEPNPDAVTGFLERSFALLGELKRAGRAGELRSWLRAYADLADRLRDSRPDVTSIITRQLAAFCTPERAAWIADLSLCEPGGRQAAGEIVATLGPAVAASFVDLLERDSTSGSGQARARIVAQLLIEHAARVAPGLAALLPDRPAAVVRTLLRVFGSAGPGYEELIARYVTSADEQTAREALRALARLGTAKAAGFVVAEIVKQRGRLSAAAEETLWHFPPHEAQRHARELLVRRAFTTNHPRATERLLDRAARAGADLGPVLVSLAPMRFRLWNPSLARVARKANAMLKAPAK